MATVVDRPGRGLYIVWNDRAGKQHWAKVDARSVDLLPGERSYGQKPAQRLKAAVETAIARFGAWPPPDEQHRGPGRQQSVAELCSAWLERQQQLVGTPEGMKPRALQGYETSLRLHVLPLLGDRPVHSLGPADLLALKESMRGKSASTVRAAMIPLRRAVAWWCLANRAPEPFGQVRLFRNGHKRKSSRRHASSSTLSLPSCASTQGTP
jgi:hypothetical protein